MIDRTVTINGTCHRFRVNTEQEYAVNLMRTAFDSIINGISCCDNNVRSIGSEDECVLCGKTYIIRGARHKYCKECAEIVRKDIIKRSNEKRKKNAGSRISETRNDKEKDAWTDRTDVLSLLPEELPLEEFLKQIA